MPNRFQQLLAALPRGNYYEAKGEVVPEGVTTLRLEAEPNTRFIVSLNGAEEQRLWTDASGVAAFAYDYRSGDYVVEFLDPAGGTSIAARLSVRTWALWYASYAAFYEDQLDAKVDASRNALSLPRATQPLLGSTYGRPLGWASDAGWSEEAYRASVIDVRQAVRLYISRPAGWRQGVAAITGANPLKLPRALLAYFAPDANVEDLLAHTGVTATPLAFDLLNVAAYSWVTGGSFAQALSIPGPFPVIDPPQALRLAVTIAFTQDVIVTFVDPNGNIDTDVFAAPGIGVHTGTKDVVQVTAISSPAAGPGVGQLGLADSRFIRHIASRGIPVLVSPSTVNTLILAPGAPRSLVVSLGKAIDFTPTALVDDEFVTRRELILHGGFGRLAELQAITSRAAATTLSIASLALNIDDRGVVPVTGRVGAERPWERIDSGGAPTTVQLADLINQAVRRDPSYGGTVWSCFITLSIPNPPNGAYYQIYDATLPDGRNVVFEFTTTPGVVSVSGRVPVDVTSGVLATIATNLAQAVNAASLAIEAVYLGLDTLQLFTKYATAAAPTAIIQSGLFGSAVTAWAGGAASPGYATRAVVATALAPPQDALRITANSAYGIGEASSVALIQEASSREELAFGYPLDDAVFGPRNASALTALAASFARFLTCPTDIIGDLPNVELTDALSSLSTTPIVSPALLSLSFATALEVGFHPDWSGGPIHVAGLDCDGVDVVEDFEVPDFNTLAEYEHLLIDAADGTRTVSTLGNIVALDNNAAFASDVHVTHWFRIRGSTSWRYIHHIGVDVATNNTQLIVSGGALPALSANDQWQIIRRPVVQGTQLFESVTSVANTVVSVTSETAWLRIRDGADDYGVDLLVGRGRTVTAGVGSGDIVPDDTSAYPDGGSPTATVAPGAFTPTGEYIGGQVYLSGSNAYGPAGFGANNGMHALWHIDPVDLSVLGTPLRIRHGEAQRGLRFQQVAGGAPPFTDYSALSNETAINISLYAAGERVRVVGKSTAPVGFVLAEPLLWAKSLGDRIEPADPTGFVQGLDEGLDEHVFEIDTTYDPGGTVVDGLTVFGSPTPDGWTVRGAGATETQHGRLAPVRLEILQVNAVVERFVPRDRWLPWRGWNVEAVIWVDQREAASVNFDLEVDFGTSVASAAGTAVAGHVIGANPTRVALTARVPTDATRFLLRLKPSASTPGAIFMIEHASVALVPPGGVWAGAESALDTGPARENAMTEFAYLWTWGPRIVDPLHPAPGGLTLVEREALGLPAPVGARAAAYLPVRGEEGILDKLTPVASPWRRADVTVYDSVLNTPLNLAGVYQSAHWNAAALEGLELVVETPERRSYVRPDGPSMVRAEPVTFAGLAATIAQNSRHGSDGPKAADLAGVTWAPFPHPSYPRTQEQDDGTATLVGDILYEGEIPLNTPRGPAVSWTPNQQFTVTQGADVLTLTYQVAGTSGALVVVAVDASVVVDRPASVGFSMLTSTLTLYLAVQDGVVMSGAGSPNSIENFAALVNQDAVISALFSAEATGPTTTTSLTAGSVVATTAVASLTSWRFTAANTIAITALAFNGAAEYTIDYERRIRATSAAFQLQGSYTDYVWYADLVAYRRSQALILERLRTEQIQFLGRRTATLSRRSNQDQMGCALVRDTGTSRVTIPAGLWQFTSATEVLIDATVFDPNSVYLFTYTSEVADFDRPVRLVLEHRSAAGGAPIGEWQVIDIDVPVAYPGGVAHDYHQLRVTAFDVPDTDIRTLADGLLDNDTQPAELTAPPFAQELKLTFTNWSGGPVVVSGRAGRTPGAASDASAGSAASADFAVSERFVPPTTPFTGELDGEVRFRMLTSVTHPAAGTGAGTLRIGLLHPTESVRIVSMGLRGVPHVASAFAPGVVPC